MSTSEEIFRDAMALPPDARAELTERLVESLAQHISPERGRNPRPPSRSGYCPDVLPANELASSLLICQYPERGSEADQPSNVDD